MKRYNPLDMQGNKVVNSADPSNPLDLVTLQYLQAFVRGLKWKDSVRAASTGTVTLATPGATLDGVTLAVNDRVLLKNQSAPAENGIYVWTASGSALTRANDANTSALLQGAVVTSTEGTVNGDKVWVQTTDVTIVIGTTAINWAAVGGSGTSYIAGNGLQLIGSTFSIVVGNGLIVDGTSLRVDPSIVSRKFMKDNAVGSSEVVTHNLGTKDITATFRLIATDEIVEVDCVATSINTATVTYSSSQSAGTIRIKITD
jgi:hypothetical protein